MPGKERLREFGDFRVDVALRRLYRRDGEWVRLTPRVFDTLLYLLEHRDRLLDKEELLAAIWPGRVVEENNLTQAISALRRALGDHDGEQILTVPGRGYRFVALSESRPRVVLASAGSARPSVDHGANVLALPVATRGDVDRTMRPPEASDETTPIASLAVLPFKPLVDDQRDDVLLLGMTELLINRLSAGGELAVRPLGVVRRYASPRQDPLVAGRQLGVEAVLDGGVLRAGKRMRVTTRLLRVADGVALWADRFDESFADVFAVQDAITERVARALALQLSGETLKRLKQRHTENVDAYQLYLAGRHHVGKLTVDGLFRAIALFERAIALDPGYALAHAGLADAYRRLPIACDLRPQENFPKAAGAATSALALDPGQAEAQTVLGFVRFWYDWDWVEAERAFVRAIELNPNAAEPHLGYSHLLSNLGRHERALAEIRRARELEPLSLIANTLEASFLSLADRDDEALARLGRVFDVDANFWVARLHAGGIALKQGRLEDAIADLRVAREQSGEVPHVISALAYAQAAAGDHAVAREALAELRAMASRRHVPASNFALIHCALVETGPALDWLERAHQMRDLRVTFLKIDWRWRPLYSQPRFVRLQRLMQLADVD
ncbi:MAG TPA: winged helix-turn-helix domain-containing protein [Myxococcaceae bacterium]|nr:winged helix-turn-helix domain-containing protein [Myxococcaceae bacterium]